MVFYSGFGCSLYTISCARMLLLYQCSSKVTEPLICLLDSWQRDCQVVTVYIIMHENVIDFTTFSLTTAAAAAAAAVWRRDYVDDVSSCAFPLMRAVWWLQVADFGLHCKISVYPRISTDILWPVFHILTEPVPVP